MDGKTKAQRCEVTCSGDTAGRQCLGLTDSMSSVPFVAQQRLPLDVRAEGPELRWKCVSEGHPYGVGRSWGHQDR